MSKTIPTGDIMALIMGITLLLLGGLLVTVFSSVSTLVTTEIGKATNTTVTDYTAVVARYAPTILSMLGLVLVIAAVAHIILILIGVLKTPTETLKTLTT